MQVGLKTINGYYGTRWFFNPTGNNWSFVINNGAAGMPNFSGMRCGLISRIATTPSPHRRCYGIARDGIFIDALPIDYDHDGFLDRFLARWPRGLAAHASYIERLMSGPGHRMAQARPAAAA